MRAKLKVNPTDGDPFEVEVGNTATIGRGPENTVSLHMSPQVSRQHAIIRCHNAYQYQIMDLGSRNGTYVNGRRVIMPVVLEHGAVIRITNNELVFEQHESGDHDSTIDMTISEGTDVSSNETATVAIMVCDVRGFSTMSEILPEDALARLLGQWFRDAGNMVQLSGGTIDKFIGDAILAYWIQGSQAGPESLNALQTGTQLLARAATMKWPVSPEKPFAIAVALHHGTVTCGNIGLVAQRDATIIGDAVNTAFRIESVMKPLGKRLVMSQDFLTTLGTEAPALDDLGDHQLKGKNQLVRLHGIP